MNLHANPVDPFEIRNQISICVIGAMWKQSHYRVYVILSILSIDCCVSIAFSFNKKVRQF